MAALSGAQLGFGVCRTGTPCKSFFGAHKIHRAHEEQPALRRPAAASKLRQTEPGRRLSCQAAGFSQPSDGSSKDDAVRLPNSREEAVNQAAAAIAAQVTPGSKGTKGFAGASQKLTVDVPVADTGSAATVQLAQDIIAALPKNLRQQFTIVDCAGDGGAAGGSGSGSSGGGVRVVSLQAVVASGEDLDGCLLIAGPTTAQLAATMRLLAYWRGAAAVVLNADWSPDGAPMEQAVFMKTFDAVYCFLPLVIKVLFIGQEGAVFKHVTSGSPSATPWRVYGKERSRLAPIGRMEHRPTNTDLEAIFYNAYAANNPLNRGIKTLRGLVTGGKDKKK